MFTKDSSFNVLYTKDLQRTHDFYKNIGAEIREFDSSKVVVGIGDFDLHIVLSKTEPHPSFKYLANSDNSNSGVIFYIEVEDIDKAFELVKENGALIKTEVFNNHWGCKEFLFEDCNGVKFAFYS